MKKIFVWRLYFDTKEIDKKGNRLDELQMRISQLKKDNELISKEIDQTVTLYELTKNMCKSLEVDEIFNIFKDTIYKYINIDDCRFLTQEEIESISDGDQKIHLEMDGKDLGYLAIKGLRKEDEEKLSILVQQLLLAVRRAVLYKKIQELAITDSLTVPADSNFNFASLWRI
ncbi:MAG: hypothetical protein NC829_02175 [Candidatus Omnitrophica bacterium]|nr:hypothetical protein [Candidatus Omnitrophota bacterium]